MYIPLTFIVLRLEQSKGETKERSKERDREKKSTSFVGLNIEVREGRRSLRGKKYLTRHIMHISTKA